MQGILLTLVVAGVFILACSGSVPVPVDGDTRDPQTLTQSEQFDGSETQPTSTPVKIGDIGLIIRDLKLDIEPGGFGGYVEVVMYNELDTVCRAALSVDLLSEDSKVVSTIAMHYEGGIPPGEEVVHGMKFIGPGTVGATVTWTSCTTSGSTR